MEKRPISLLAGLLMFVSASAAEPAGRFEGVRQLPATEWEVKGGGPKSFWCPRIANAPTLDGKLDEPCWERAGRARGFIKADGGMAVEVKADYPTQVLACRDERNIYMAWTVTGEIAREIAASPKKRFRNDIGNYKDCYSVAFKMIGGDNEYLFYLNSKGNTGASSLRERARYKGAFSAKSAPTKDGAVIELAIPFSNPGLHVPGDGEWWRVQLNRVSNYEWSAHNIQFCAFDYLYFGSEEAFRRQSLPIPPQLALYGERYVYYRSDGKTQFVAALRGKLPEGATVLLQLFQGEKVIDKRLVADFAKPYLAFIFDQRNLAAGAYRMQATLRDKTAKTLLEGRWPFTVTDKKEPAIPFPAEGVRVNVHAQDKLADAAWPVSTGVPLPRGAIKDVSELALFENGKPIPANIVSRATWYPTLTWNGSAPQAGDGNSLKWVGVSFVARYEDGKTRTYILRRGPSTTSPAASRLTVREDDKQVLISTGPAQLAINKASFDGVHAWLDRDRNGTFGTNEKLLLGGGPYIVDQNGNRYSPSGPLPDGRKIEVSIEEKGTARVVVTVKGWYHSPARKPLCIYNTRIIAFNSLPFFQVQQRTILTCDNREIKLADIGFAFKTPRPEGALLGTDTGMLPAVPKGQLQSSVAKGGGTWSTSLHQDRSNHFRLIHEWTDKQKSARRVGREGKRADGHAAVSGRDFSVSVFLKHVWEKYPKELEVGSSGIAVHFWPRHGYDAFAGEEVIGKEHLHKLRFSHTGKLLNLQIPDSYLQRLRDIDKLRKYRTDGPQECLYGYGSPGRGVGIANDFLVLLQAKRADTPVLTAALVRQDPGAYADPEYACATDAFDKIRHQDLKNFPKTEKALEKTHLALYRFFENSEAWGMFTFAGYNTSHTAGVNYPTNLARLWGNSHYQEASAAWLQYFRSGNPEMLKWARAHSEHFTNIGTCNYDDPDHPVIASNPDGTTKGFHVPMAGQQFHCKSPVPWGGPLASNGHFIDPQSIFMRYCLEGDYAAMDTFALWGTCLARAPVDMTPHRDTNCTIAHILAYYAWSWDPYALALIHECAVPLHNTPFAKHGAGSFHKYWAARYFDLTRNPQTLDRIKEWAETVGIGALGWQIDPPAAALLYRQTADKKYLPVMGKGPAAYDNPEDPWHGYSQEAFGPYAGFLFSGIPGGMHAVAQAGLTEDTGNPVRGRTPQTGTVFKDRSGRDTDTEVLLLRKDDRAFQLVLENTGSNEAQTTIRLLGPDGKALVAPLTTRYDGRYIGPRALRVAVPKGGAPGLVQLAMRGGARQFSFFMPASDLDGEAAVMRPDTEYKLRGPVYCVAPQPGQKMPVAFTFEAADVAAIRLADGKGVEIMNTSIAKGLKRERATVTVDPNKHPLPWMLDVRGSAKVRVEHVKRLYLSPDMKRLNGILKALENGN